MRRPLIAKASMLVALLQAFGCGGDDNPSTAPQLVVVLSTFPAEMAPILEQTTVEDTVTVNERVFRIGTLRGVPVVVGLTGIGLANAKATTAAVLERFTASGVVVSGVAGSPLRIGDVAVPESWRLMDDATTYPTYRPWFDLATDLAATNAVALDRCTEVPPVLSEDPVCMPHVPAIFAGGEGQSEDAQSELPRFCQPGGDDVFGCDLPVPEVVTYDTTAAAVEEPSAVDMESAAIAREASARGLPFIAFRAVSDGTGDPLNLPGFPAQFFAYYHLAARNAAAVAVAFVERLAARD